MCVSLPLVYETSDFTLLRSLNEAPWKRKTVSPNPCAINCSLIALRQVRLLMLHLLSPSQCVSAPKYRLVKALKSPVVNTPT